MRGTGWMFIALAAAAQAGPVAAQADVEDSPEMEMQRCVWSCLANSPGADSAEYNACVARLCDDGAAEPAPQTNQPSGWTVGVTSDGRGHYAGVADPQVQTQLFYMCDAAGQSLLKFQGISGEGIVAVLTIDGVPQSVPFLSDGTSLYALAPVDGPLFAALLRGRSLSLRDGPQGPGVGDYSLTGSSQAIARARSGCR